MRLPCRRCHAGVPGWMGCCGSICAEAGAQAPGGEVMGRRVSQVGGLAGGCATLRDLLVLVQARQSPPSPRGARRLQHRPWSVRTPWREQGRCPAWHWPGTFVARVDPLRQQQAAELALGTRLLLHLGQVGRHAEGVVADLVLVVLPDTVGSRQKQSFAAPSLAVSHAVPHAVGPMA